MRPFLALRQKLRGALQRYGPATVKAWVWDAEFAAGRWEGLEHMRGDCLYPILERYSARAAILDLGCGPGATANEIDGGYTWYTGVDISAVALDKARRRSLETGRHDKVEFIQADLAVYRPTRGYDVMLFADSLYYIREQFMPGVLERCTEHLSPTGVCIARSRACAQSGLARANRVSSRWASGRGDVPSCRPF